MAERVDTVVVHAPERQRYEAYVGGALAGFAAYVPREDVVLLTHTQVDGQWEGRGVGSALAAGTLDALRSAGRSVVPLCPFIASYVERHPDYADLIAHRPAPRVPREGSAPPPRGNASP